MVCFHYVMNLNGFTCINNTEALPLLRTIKVKGMAYMIAYFYWIGFYITVQF